MSYDMVGDIWVGMSEADVVALDPPVTIKRKRYGETVCGYADKQVTLIDDRVVEVGSDSEAKVQVDGEDVFGDPGAFRRLCDRDGAPLERLGFIILLTLGVTLTGSHDNLPKQLAVTAFDRGRWDDMMAEVTPYRPR